MKYKNYYKILGLEGPRATDNEIKSAYRKLAKKYHPDINPGNLLIAEKFKDINEAYQVLTDEELKRKYNVKHYAYSFKDIFSIKNIQSKIATSGSNEFIEMFVGKNYKIKNKAKDRNMNMTGENLESEISITLEEAFNGVNKKISFKSHDDTMKTITLKVPSGIVDGGKIRIKGQGKPGKTGGKAGDLLIKVRILENKRFKLDHSNLLVNLPLTPSEAILGCDVELEGIDSKTTINITPGTGSGELLRLEGKGYYDENGQRGDLVVKTEIVVPKEITKKERELYQKLQEITNFMPRSN